MWHAGAKPCHAHADGAHRQARAVGFRRAHMSSWPLRCIAPNWIKGRSSVTCANKPSGCKDLNSRLPTLLHVMAAIQEYMNFTRLPSERCLLRMPRKLNSFRYGDASIVPTASRSDDAGNYNDQAASRANSSGCGGRRGTNVSLVFSVLTPSIWRT